ncbi:hypothetical protein NIES2119_09765 [[Phormidium ambiguum] IAM M-71]|uniref:Uncharacterized protein n=1 Tax=[Phormidium ambiguum] IAM M-71 TaxID=454136 RepID=A0A1U7IM01_9CYAN|nr:hypothetical protein NIES2119_09765 [Phormidium ambiguum IAM M-71]
MIGEGNREKGFCYLSPVQEGRRQKAEGKKVFIFSFSEVSQLLNHFCRAALVIQLMWWKLAKYLV